MLAANTNILDYQNHRIEEFSSLVRFMFDSGMLLNDDLEYKLALLSASTGNAELVKALTEDITKITTPEAESADKIIDENTSALMNELQNTIVTFDRESLRHIRKQRQKDKMQL